MAIKTYKPTSASRRQMSTVDYSVLTVSKSSPLKLLTKHLKNKAARNHRGIITVRHQGGGNKKTYRMVDFKQDKFDIPGRVETIEYDPYRTAFIALVAYKDGERRYVVASHGMKKGDVIVTSETTPLKIGNRMALKNILVGAQVHNIEMQRGCGGKLIRSAGSAAEVLGHDAGYTTLKMPSKEVRRIVWDSLATVGQVSNVDWSLVNFGKAGRSRWMGIRPTVRGTAMNPCDHKYGGGEQRQPRGTKRPKDIWGNITGGKKTRNPNKWSNKLIVRRRPKIS